MYAATATTVDSRESVKTEKSGWGFSFIPDFSSLWGKYRTSTEEFDKDGFDVNFPCNSNVASKSDAIDIDEPGYEENSVNNQARSYPHGIFEEKNLNGKRSSKLQLGKGASTTQNEPVRRRSKRLIQNAPKIMRTETDTIATRFEKKACSDHHSKKMKNKTLQAPDSIKLKAFSQPRVSLKKYVSANGHCDISSTATPQRFRCIHCAKVCASKHHLKAHVVSKHNPSPLLCNFCGKQFGTQVSLKKHQAYQEACKKVQHAFYQ